MRKQRSYDPDFKKHISKLVVEEGKKAKDVSREMEVPYKNILRWAKEYREKQQLENGEINYVTPSDHKKITDDLLHQIQELQEENEILKKAAHIFMKNAK